MSAGAVPYPIIPPQAAFERHVTKPGDEFGELSPQQQANVNERGDLEKQQAATIERERQQQNQFDAIDAQHRKNAADAMQAIDDEKARQDVDKQKDIAAHQNRLEQAYKEGREQPSVALFADAKAGEKAKKSFGLLMAGLGDALTAYGAAKTGRGAPTHSFAEIVDYDLQRQRDKIAKLKDNVIMERTGVDDAKKAREVAMAALDAKGAGFMKRLESFAEARKASAKEGDQNWILANKALAAAREERLKYQQQSLAPLTIKHQDATVGTISRTESPTKQAGGGGVEADKNAANFGLLKEHADWIADVMPTLSPRDIEDIVAAKSGQTLAQKYPAADAAGKVLLGHDSQSGISPRAKEFLDRSSRAEDAIGRLKSGGAINNDEGSRFSGYLNPMLSDSQKDLQMRAKNIKTDNAILGGFMGRNPRNPEAPTGPPAGTKQPPLIPTAPVGSKNDVPPAAPTPGATVSPRQRWIDTLKLQPKFRTTTDGKNAMAAYHITEEDLGR